MITIADYRIQEKRRLLNRVCITSIKKANAIGTKKNYRTHHAAYVRFCNEYQLPLYPAEDWKFCQFAQFLAWEQKIPDTCDNYVGTIRKLHRLAGMKCPDRSQIHYSMLIDGLRRQCIAEVKQADPITHDILTQLYFHVDFS